MEDFRKEGKMKKVFKSLAALLLALTIVVSATPQTAHAAALRDYAQYGSTYKVYTVLPGKVKVYANARVSYLNSYTTDRGQITRTSVQIDLKFPKSQQKKIERNAAHILKSSPIVKKVGRWIYRRNYIPFGATVMTGDTHKTLTLANTNSLGGISYGSFSPSGYKSVRQGRYNFSYYRNFTYFYTAVYATAYYGGNVLFGVCGTKKPTFDNNSAIDDFISGYTPIERCNFYNGKSSKNSIWVRQ